MLIQLKSTWCFLVTAGLVTLFTACGTTKKAAIPEWRRCQIHHCPLVVETLPAVVGMTIYNKLYHDGLRTNFLHHGRFRYLETYMDIHTVHADVCPECTKAFDEWLAEKMR
jgi:hypothetical protein